VADDQVAVAATAAWTFAHLGGDPRRYRVEVAPARVQQLDLAVELVCVHRLDLDA
jgi:hypothetical protein